MVGRGEVLARKYRVERVLGVGGMGLLVAATDLYRHDRVALKLMRPEALGSPELVARFHREAATASRLTSEHVARVRDVGTLDGGEPYLAMELLEGEDVSSILARCGRLQVVEAVDVVLQACEALAEAHAIGIVHRDVSPANVFVARTPAGPVVKVLDFGVATADPFAGPVPQMTRTGTVLGCPLYASPEQLESSKHVDARSDLWSLGAILYELLTGRTPYVAESLGGLLGAIHLTEPPPIPSLRGDAPPELCRIVERCLAKDRDARFSSADELAFALRPFGSPPRRAPSLAPTHASAPGRGSASPAVAIVLVALFVIILAGAGGMLAYWVKHRAPHGAPDAQQAPYQRTSAQPQ